MNQRQDWVGIRWLAVPVDIRLGQLARSGCCFHHERKDDRQADSITRARQDPLRKVDDGGRRMMHVGRRREKGQ